MQKANRNWLVHFKGNENLALRFEDQIESHLRTYKTILTPFLDETQQEILKKVAGNRVPLSFFGGYRDAERKRALIGDEDDFDIVMLCARLSEYDKVTHSDCMGALYNCGCKSEHFGDILLDDHKVIVFVTGTIGDAVKNNCTSIRHSKVSFEESTDKIEKKANIRLVHVIVSNLRLDSLVSAITHLSRAKAQNLIRAKNVKVNHVCLEQTDFLCHNDYILSIRGYGRFVVKDIVKTTKSDRLVIEIGIYC